MIEPIFEKKYWDEVLTKISDYDCHHTFEYHAISKQKDETAMLLVYEYDDVIIALPLIKRSIPGSDYFDCTSAYGYVGPIFCSNVQNEDFLKFQVALEAYFKKQKIVCVFTRLNPFIANQENAISNLGDIEVLGNVIQIDLSTELQKQRAGYSKITKRYINKAKRHCDIKKSLDEQDILTFKDMYYENMDRVKANKSYYFTKEYFLDIIKTKDFETEVIYAVLKETGQIISGAIMMKKNKLIHYHLSGTLTKYMHLNPLRMILDEAREQGAKETYNFMNLGGGLSVSVDSLFRFKSTFSKDFKKFKIWKYIVDEKVYRELVKAKNNGTNNYFPSYRYKV